jgi:hypothetical protein
MPRKKYGVSARRLVLVFPSMAMMPEAMISRLVRQTLNYIEIPVIGRFFLNKEGTLRPNLFVGPSFGFLTGATNKVGGAERTKIDGWENTFNNFDFGVTGGIGFNVLISPETYFIIDGRYTHGLSDVTKAPGVVNNNSLGLTVGLSFGF